MQKVFWVYGPTSRFQLTNTTPRHEIRARDAYDATRKAKTWLRRQGYAVGELIRGDLYRRVTS